MNKHKKRTQNVILNIIESKKMFAVKSIKELKTKKKRKHFSF